MVLGTRTALSCGHQCFWCRVGAECSEVDCVSKSARTNDATPVCAFSDDLVMLIFSITICVQHCNCGMSKTYNLYNSWKNCGQTRFRFFNIKYSFRSAVTIFYCLVGMLLLSICPKGILSSVKNDQRDSSFRACILFCLC